MRRLFTIWFLAVLLGAAVAAIAHPGPPPGHPHPHRHKHYRRYAILNNNPPTRSDVIFCINNGRCVHTGMGTVRRSCTSTSIVVKWNHDKQLAVIPPRIATRLANQGRPGKIYRHSQILDVMALPAWSDCE